MDMDQGAVEQGEAKDAEQIPTKELSSSDDDDDEEKTMRKILEIEKNLSKSPYDYQSHIDLIENLRKAGELEKLMQARSKMAEIFPLTQILWLQWIEDEKRFAQSEEDHSKIVELFEKAVEDYMSPDVWLEYCQYGIRWMESPEGLKRIRGVMERAISCVGLHVTEGAALWETYREFENALLLNMQSEKVVSKEEQEKVKKQREKISSLFKGQLGVPLFDMESTYQEYREWCGGDVDPGTERVYKQSLKQLAELKPFEDALMQAAPPRYEQYQTYIQHEIKTGNQERIQSIYERALVENCLNSELWLHYLNYMNHQHLANHLLVKLHLRSVRNCPWTGQLWMQYLLALERDNASKDKLNTVFEEALAAGFTSAKEYVELWKLKCSQIRRQIEMDVAEKAELSECFARAKKHITESLVQAFGESGDANYSIWIFWARCEASVMRSKGRAAEILQTLVQEDADARRKLCIWRELYDIERLYGSEDKVDNCRSILRQAVQNCAILPDANAGGVPDAELACEMLLDFERLHGNLEKMDESLRRASNKLSRIAKRREKDEARIVEHQQKHKQKPRNLQRNKKVQNPRKRKSTDETKGKNRNVEGVLAPKQQKMIEAAESGSDKFKAPAGLPMRYVKKSRGESAAKFSDTPPGFKAPTPGFQGPPGSKQSFQDKAADQNNNKNKEAAIQSSAISQAVDFNKKTIFVSNIDFKISDVEQKLQSMFCNCGRISDVRLVKNNKGQFRGFGYIEFDDESAALKALTMDRQTLDGRPLFVSPNVDKKKEPNFKVFKYEVGLEKHKLFVSNLSFHTTEETLKNEFSRHGSVKSVRIVTNRRGVSKGLAYVEYEREAEAAQALLRMDGEEVDGFTVKVAISNPPARKPVPETAMLGGNREQFKGGRGRGRTQLSMVPRSLNRADKTTTDFATGGMKNQDFANMLQKK